MERQSDAQRSPRFPFISLRKALDRAEQLRAATGGRSIPISVLDARKVWGYGAKSSGGDQTLAALKSYGLIEASGSGDARKIQLSEAATRYFRDERPEVRSRALVEFAWKPRMLAHLWNEWGATPPSDPIARSILRNELGVSDGATEDFLRVYKENLSF